MDNYKLLRDKGRHLAYREAVIRLKTFPEPITDAKQLDGLYKIGIKIKRKIQEIIETGTLARVDAMNEQQYLSVLKQFQNIWGVGASTADKLYKQGYKSVVQLRQNPPKWLNHNQQIGLRFYEDFLEKIPREEVKEICDIVEVTAKEMFAPRELTVIPCGSYRRGRQFCGDIDILMSFEDQGPFEGSLSQLVQRLTESGLITHRLNISDKWDTHKKSRSDMFAGVCRIGDRPYRRIDIKFYPRNVFAWALLHFTGSANFNRSIRLFAKKVGFRMSDEGFFPALRIKGDTRHGDNVAVCYTEEDIFALFGVDYKTPEERDI